MWHISHWNIIVFDLQVCPCVFFNMFLSKTTYTVHPSHYHLRFLHEKYQLIKVRIYVINTVCGSNKFKGAEVHYFLFFFFFLLREVWNLNFWDKAFILFLLLFFVSTQCNPSNFMKIVSLKRFSAWGLFTYHYIGMLQITLCF